MNPIIPDGYRPLKYGEMMQKGDIIWKHPGQWEVIYNNFETYSKSFRPMARKINNLAVKNNYQINMRILLIGGWFTGSKGKAQMLALMGHKVYRPDLSNFSTKKAIKQAQKALDDFQPDVIIGASRGGAIVAALKYTDIFTILMCPAWRHFGNLQKDPHGSLILHGVNDTTIKPKDSFAFAKHPRNVILVNDGHQLNFGGMSLVFRLLKRYKRSKHFRGKKKQRLINASKEPLSSLDVLRP
jgi:hypothetical protein